MKKANKEQFRKILRATDGSRQSHFIPETLSNTKTEDNIDCLKPVNLLLYNINRTCISTKTYVLASCYENVYLASLEDLLINKIKLIK